MHSQECGDFFDRIGKSMQKGMYVFRACFKYWLLWLRDFPRTFTCLLFCSGLLWYNGGTYEFVESIWCLRRNELTVVIFLLVHTTVLSIKTAFNLANIHLLFPVMLLNQWSVNMSYRRPYCYCFWEILNLYPVCNPNICWHSLLKNKWKFL